MDESETIETLVIGAGMAGLTCALTLAEAGQLVRLLDKGRGPGGRMATRRVEFAGQELRFDHGAQYFTARDPQFQQTVAQWAQAGIVARWPAAGDDAWVGTPGMNAPIRAMAEAVDVSWGTRVESVIPADAGWDVQTSDQTLVCSNLVIAIPSEQAAELLQGPAPDFAQAAGDVRSYPCWAVLAYFAERLDAPDVIRNETGPISWAARNGAKPLREAGETWVIHASPQRSTELLELDKEDVAQALLGDFFKQIGIAPVNPAYLTAHRWRYAMPQPGDTGSALWDPKRRMGLAGDWLHSPRVEGAYLSGRALAEQILSK